MQSKQRKPRWRRVLTFLIVLGSGYVLVCFGLAKLYVSPLRTPPPSISLFKRVTLPDGEPIWISPDLHSKPKATTLYVMSHGLGGGVGYWSEIGKRLVAKGYDVVLTELPAHGDSPDDMSGFGTKESDVIVEATRWAQSKYAKRPRTVLVGVSLGGSASWLATAKAPDLFDAIVTEGAFARLNDVTDNWFDSRIPDGHIIFWPVKLFASELTGIDPATINPIDAARKWHKPALVIHCGEDALMKRSYADDLAAASGAKLWIIPKAEHAHGCSVDPQEYFKRLIAFAKPNSKKDQPSSSSASRLTPSTR
jgi:pimeloyl-ACP methyl ester carboxylesterase